MPPLNAIRINFEKFKSPLIPALATHQKVEENFWEFFAIFRGFEARSKILLQSDSDPAGFLDLDCGYCKHPDKNSRIQNISANFAARSLEITPLVSETVPVGSVKDLNAQPCTKVGRG